MLVLLLGVLIVIEGVSEKFDSVPVRGFSVPVKGGKMTPVPVPVGIVAFVGGMGKPLEMGLVPVGGRLALSLSVPERGFSIPEKGG